MACIPTAPAPTAAGQYFTAAPTDYGGGKTDAQRANVSRKTFRRQNAHQITDCRMVVLKRTKAAALMNCRKANRPSLPALPPAAKKTSQQNLRCQQGVRTNPSSAPTIINALSIRLAVSASSSPIVWAIVGSRINHKPWDYEADKEDAIKRCAPPVARREQGFDVFMGRRCHFIAQ